MNFDLILGIAAIAFGLVTLATRLFGGGEPSAKKQAMGERFGARTGEILHLVAYTLLPIVFGALLVYLAIWAR
ncbi:MAG: hypothetical protein AB7O39_02315 [Flavobacteriaceae bacterium]